jgi:ribosomal-protein-alanine N-acetyltransferase
MAQPLKPIAMQQLASFRTARLTLRALTEKDATQTYCDWLNDPAINKYLECRFNQHSTSGIANFISETNESPNDLLLGIFLADKHIGNIKIGEISHRHKHASVGLLLGDASAWGKGYGTEAIQGVTQLALREMGLNKLVAGCYASNLGSYKAFLKAGYEQEARLKDYWLLGDRPEDHVQLGITATQWQALWS